jgi:hypothetical protein
MGGNNAGVGIGFNTTLNSGLLCCIAPNVVWKTMTYKANDHQFHVAGNTHVAGMNNAGIYVTNAGYFTSYNQGNTGGLGLTGGSFGDVAIVATNTGVTRIYAGTTQITSFLTIAGAPSQLWKGIPTWFIEGTGVNIYMNSAQAGYWDVGVAGNGWRMNANNQLALGGGSNYVNIKTPAQADARPADWAGGCLFTSNYTSYSRSAGLNIGFNDAGGYGTIICLQPSVAWRDIYLTAANIYAYSFGVYAAVLGTGGWTNVSDEREKTNIKPLKTTRSLERVLAAKTFTYNRLFHLDSSGNDLTPQEVKDKAHVGIVAQQVQESNPHCLSTFTSVNSNNEERFSVNYNDYVIHLLGAVQEQQKMIDQLVKKDTDKDATIQQLIEHVAKLTEVVNKLSTGAITPR